MSHALYIGGGILIGLVIAGLVLRAAIMAAIGRGLNL